MWTVISQLLGIGLTSIAREIKDYRLRALSAETEAGKIQAEAKISELETRADVVKSNRSNIIQFLWAFPFIIYVWKILLWDKILGWGVTDPLSPTFEYILWTVLGGSFVLGWNKIKRL